jgi:hypothetical protein
VAAMAKLCRSGFAEYVGYRAGLLKKSLKIRTVKIAYFKFAGRQ